jgi:hypothetical protein
MPVSSSNGCSRILVESPDTDKATTLIESVFHGASKLLQPVHWLAELAAVLARLSPDTAIDVELLSAMEIATSNEPQVSARATTVAPRTQRGTPSFSSRERIGSPRIRSP